MGLAQVNRRSVSADFQGSTASPNRIPEYENSGYGKFKGDLAEIIVEKLRPIQDNLARFKQDRAFIVDVLKYGQENAAKIANKTRQEVFSLAGLI